MFFWCLLHFFYVLCNYKFCLAAHSQPPSALVSPSSTRPSSRADRRLRFAELEPEDVHVYESAPSSPKRRALALPPPDPGSKDTVSLGQWKGKMLQDAAPTTSVKQGEQQQTELVTEKSQSRKNIDQEVEGTAEYIRQRYFPNSPSNDPNLAWIYESPKPDSTSPTLRFDLQGNIIPPSISLTLPTHLGLHHHAEGAHAGYTLDDIFLLSRSTVPAQRAAMLGIMSRIARRLAGVKKGEAIDMEALVGKEEDLRKRFLAAGLEALSERGSVGALAIEVIWECVVCWRLDFVDVEGVELETPEEDSVITSIPLEFFLPQIATILLEGAHPHESQTQLLSVLHRLSQHNNEVANRISSTPKLLATILQVFLLTPISPDESSRLPEPLALRLFHALSLSSRSNAEEIEKFADSFLRFVTFLPSSSPYLPSVTTNLITWTLRIYRALAAYGLQTHIASVAVAPFAQLEQYILSKECTSYSLKEAWLNLVEVWMICATDPHQTTPPHDIKWSQIISWRWDAGILELLEGLGIEESEWAVWASAWKAEAAWLEGSKINAIKGGEVEKDTFLASARHLSEDGTADKIINAALDRIEQSLVYANISELKALAGYCAILSSVIRLWMACIPPHGEGSPSSPPFLLPFSRLSSVAARLVNFPLWSSSTVLDSSTGYLYCREISQFLVFFLRLSKRLPNISQSLWMAQSFSILLRLGPGDEDMAELIIQNLTKLITSDWVSRNNVQASVIWEKGGLAILEPFLYQKLRPTLDVYIAPLSITPKSVKRSTTQRLPSPTGLKQFGLPLSRDWTMTALDHLLRSADSPVFKSLPSSWDASEIEVTRASLFLTKVVQKTLLVHCLTPLVLTREEAIFRCMQVFMLEHGQTENDSSEEVFRDNVVGLLMEEILQIYAFGHKPSFPSTAQQESIEDVAVRFLGPSIPFFQFYTDFIALYDAISFSHPLFASLLLPPTTMSYAQDYRKHLWCDFGHILNTVRPIPERVLCADLEEYLYPVETNAQILSSQLHLLLKGNLREFPRLIALHHIASNIWPDLKEGGAKKPKDERASTMLNAVIQQGGNEVVREVVRYHQIKPSSGRRILYFPDCCYDLDEELVCLRKNCVSNWGGEGLVSKIAGLLTVEEEMCLKFATISA